MCDRYSFALSKEKIRRRFDVKLIQVPEVSYNISPGQPVAVITDAFADVLSIFSWGLRVPDMNKKSGFRMINAFQTESLPVYPHLKTLLETKRCLLLADGFYCWKKVSKKGVVPYRVVLKWNLPFAMAGIWDTHLDTSTGNVRHVCAVLTTPANALLSHINKHMPAVLPIEHEKMWLNQKISLEEAMQLLQSYPAQGMKLFSVSSLINATNINTPQLIQPAEPVDQFGNYILFPEN
jgi:putative SOS response-associated peptidase YedK